VASVRAAIQLTIVAAALRGVFAAPVAVIAVIAVMFGLATWTSARRLRDQPAPLGLWCWPVALVRQSRSE